MVRFMSIHKIVLGLQHGHISTELRNASSLIDVPDSSGRTPLSWADQQGDEEIVKLLLRPGTDPNTFDIAKMALLHFAAQANFTALCATSPELWREGRSAGSRLDTFTLYRFCT